MIIKYGKYEFENGIFLAPMAGYTDRAMRVVCKNMGADLSFTEMISAKAVTFGDKKTEQIGAIGEDEGPVVLQIFGKEPGVISEASGILMEKAAKRGVCPVGIDINMGCPVNKIFSNGEGSALMRNPTLIFDLVKAAIAGAGVPVSVKIRSGIDEGHINAVECALAAEDGGACMVTVHGRTRVQMYGGQCDGSIIRAVKESLRIPVVYSGDVKDYESYKRALDVSGADGVMIGRGAVGNPFVFREIKTLAKGGAFSPPSLEERIRVALWQLKLATESKGERVAIPESRKQIALYFKGEAGAAALRGKINSLESYLEIKELLTETFYGNKD